MKKINKRDITFAFDNKIYDIDRPIFISSDLFWDGGINANSSLEDKYQFYFLSKNMSDIVKRIISLLQEEVYVSRFFCENSQIYAPWVDLKKHKLFQIVSRRIKKNGYYQLTFPEDDNLIDLIVESNFLYFTNISFYLPNSKVVIQPTCHTELIIYSYEIETLNNILQKATEPYSNIKIKQYNI